MEYLLYPMKNLRITQGYGQSVDGVPKCTYSHGGQPAALDHGGAKPSPDADWVYAPCSCKVVRIGSRTYNIVYFQSLEKVRCRDGVDRYVNWRFMHINDTDFNALGLKLGKTFKQGEKCYREGQKGAPGATHMHSEFGDGVFVGTGCYSTGSGTSINKPLPLNKICWLSRDTTVMNGYGYSWAVLPATSTGASSTNMTVPQHFDGTYRKGKKYTVTTALNIRKGAGTDQVKLGVLPQGSYVMWYGYYTERDGDKWLYVVAQNGLTGFVSAKYLK